MPTACEGDAIALMIKYEIRHTDKHVFLNVGIKLPVYFSQNIGRRRIPRRLSTQNAAANRHDQRCRNAFARNVGDCNAKPFVIDMNVIKIIAAHLAGGHVNAADLKPLNGRRFRRKQNPLNIPCNLEIVIESLLFIRHRVNDGVVKGKGGLFGNRFKNNEIALRKRRAHWAIGNGEDTELLFSVGKRCRHHGGSPKSTVT